MILLIPLMTSSIEGKPRASGDDPFTNTVSQAQTW